MTLPTDQLKKIIEGVIFAAGEPTTLDRIQSVFEEGEKPSVAELCACIEDLTNEYEDKSIELAQVASGYQFRVRTSLGPWISKLFHERPVKYSRTFLETLAIITYRQPVTRAEIEKIRGVAVNTAIVKTLLERNWIKVIGHRDLPGKPSLYATTKDFLDHLGLRSLEELPMLPNLQDLEKAEAVLEDKLSETEKVLVELMDKSSVEEGKDSEEGVIVALPESIEMTDEIEAEYLADCSEYLETVNSDSAEHFMHEKV